MIKPLLLRVDRPQRAHDEESPSAAALLSISSKTAWRLLVTFRVTDVQREWLDQMSELHGLSPSELLRGLIDGARADHAMATT